MHWKFAAFQTDILDFRIYPQSADQPRTSADSVLIILDTTLAQDEFNQIVRGLPKLSYFFGYLIRLARIICYNRLRISLLCLLYTLSTSSASSLAITLQSSLWVLSCSITFLCQLP